MTISNLNSDNCKVQWVPGANTKQGCNFVTFYPPTAPSLHLISDPTLLFSYQFNSFGNAQNITVQLLPGQQILSSTLTYDLQSITLQLSNLQPNQKQRLSFAPFYFQCTGQTPVSNSSSLKVGDYTLTFAIANTGQHPDGWCNQIGDKTYLCTLNFNNNTNGPSSNGTGSGMKDPSPTPLYTGEAPYCWPSWFPNDTKSHASGKYDYYCGFFQKTIQDMTSLTNSKGYTFTFTSIDPSKNQDGWCQNASGNNTYLCTLESGNNNNIHLTQGDGSSMKHGSPQPLTTGQLPFCKPSWMSSPSNPNPQPHTAGRYNYYCGFFKQGV